ncbi:MAG TPA: thioredoxin-like domain-containing protein [Brumimicrobium sp.]|nr:thioredoxin-like domain-containing protein [Brumimicrobium sp.]
MKLINTLILTAFIGISGFAQNLTFKVSGVEDATVHLVKYVGSKLYYADTAQIVNGKVAFDGSKQEPGIMALLLPGQSYFEFVYNNENVNIETKSPDFVEHMVVKESKENKIFLAYIKFMKANRESASKLQQELAALDSTQTEKKTALNAEIKKVGNDVLTYQNKVVAENPNTLVAKIIKMSTDIQIPESPKNEEGEPINKSFSYEYFRDHYFDNIDLTDDRLVNTPVLQNKLEYFYSKSMLIQHPDSIIKYIHPIVDQTKEGSMMYRFFVTTITSHFEKSKIMGMDKVTNYMINRYYCAPDQAGEPKGYWMDAEKLEELCKDTKKRLRLVQGEIPPNIILTDSTNKKWYNLYETEADYIILYFWDPGCGHCKKVTPQLETLYSKKLKERNVEIFAVGKATGDDYEDWKKFIRTKGLSYINVGLTRAIYDQAKEDPRSLIPSKTTLESVNYQDTYDIFSTPRVWILDKDKKIIAKSLTIAQIETLLDELQGHKDAEKLFELEESPDDIK